MRDNIISMQLPAMCDVTEQNIQTPFGTLIYDGTEPNFGTRYHLVDGWLEFPVVWQNSIVIGVNSWA